MLHHHGVCTVDKVLIWDYAADGACPVKAVFGGIPVEISDRVETASGLCSVYNTLACGFFKAYKTEGAVLFFPLRSRKPLKKAAKLRNAMGAKTKIMTISMQKKSSLV